METFESIEYKVGKEDVCGYCSKPNHKENNCFSKQRDTGVNKKKFGGYDICGSDEHWKNECPEKGTLKDKKQSINRSGLHAPIGGQKGRRGNSFSSGSNGVPAGRFMQQFSSSNRLSAMQILFKFKNLCRV